MSIANPVVALLRAQGVQHTLLQRPASETLEEAAMATGASLDQVARAVITKDGDGMIMAVVPASRVLEFAVLNEQLWRDLELAPAKAIASVFKDCEPLSYPPLGLAFDVETVVERSLLEADPVYFASGRRQCLLRVSGEDFRRLLCGAESYSFARPINAYDLDAVSTVPRKPAQGAGTWLVTQRLIEKIDGLPAMPQMVKRILELRSNAKADAEDLAKVVELDPSLAFQVMRYAGSAFYGYRGKINSIRDAIARVLGFDMVMNLALALAAGRSFKLPYDGPLGLNAYWRDAIYGAVLAQQLATYTPFDSRPFTGMAYLAGLLHNFGYLVLGYLFPREFALLNRLVVANPDVALTDLERHVMGVGHEQVGAWLAKTWHLPGELMVAIRWHHSERYRAEHALYSQMVLAADRLLRRNGVGDAPNGKLPAAVLEALGISEQQALMVLDSVMARCQDMETVARQLTR